MDDKITTYPEFITIVGCGNLGSALARMIVLKSLEKDTKIERLCLIDNDILEPKNMPYLHSTDKWYEYKPKAFALRDILSELNYEININAYYDTYPNLYNIIGKTIYDIYIIDCRDTASEHHTSLLKFNLDGQYGVINLNPKDIDSDDGSRYVINSSRYYANIFAGLCCQIIFKDLILDKNKYLVDLKRGTYYEFVPNGGSNGS